MSRTRLAPLLLAVCLVAAACGDDTETGDGDTSPTLASTAMDESDLPDDADSGTDDDGTDSTGEETDGEEDAAGTDDTLDPGLDDEVAAHPLAPALLSPDQVEAAGLGGGWTVAGASITPGVETPTTEDFCGQPFETDSSPEEVQIHLLGEDGTSIDHVIAAPGPGVDTEFDRLEALAGCAVGVQVTLEAITADVAGAVRSSGVSGDDGTNSIMILGAEFDDVFSLIAVTQPTGGTIDADAVAALLAGTSGHL